MLLEIAISEFALIDRGRLELTAGFTVLTGETGAGKSMIIDAVAAALGGRTSSDVVRAGAERAVVEAVFRVADQPQVQTALADEGIEVGDDGLLIVRREIHQSRGSTIRLNGRTVTTAAVRRLLAPLLDLHGQHEHQSLLSPQRQLDLLDHFGGAPVLERRARCEDLYRQLQATRQELAALGGDARQRARHEDLLRFQVAELQGAGLRPDEEDELEQQKRVLAAAGQLRAAAEQGYAVLYEGSAAGTPVHDLLGQVEREIAAAARLDPSLDPVLELLTGAQAQVAEASHALARYRDTVADDPARLHEIEQRLDLLWSLKRKYGGSVAEMLTYLEQARAELERLGQSEELAAALRQKEADLLGRLQAEASELSAARRAAGAKLAARLGAEAAGLSLGGMQFAVAVQPLDASHDEPLDEPPDAACTRDAATGAGRIGPRGADRVEFRVSPGPGEPLRPLARIASGGELSRIMLALRVILADVDRVPVLIFDEVDQGVSGRAAQSVGEKLALIAGDRQVLCVTHLPQVAALADHHHVIHKAEEGGRTVTRVSALTDTAARAEEIARLLSGAAITPLSLQTAKEMLTRAEEQHKTARARRR